MSTAFRASHRDWYLQQDQKTWTNKKEARCVTLRLAHSEKNAAQVEFCILLLSFILYWCLFIVKS